MNANIAANPPTLVSGVLFPLARAPELAHHQPGGNRNA